MRELPSLEYRYAFDLCAAEVEQHRRPLVVVASGRFYVRELMERMQHLEPVSVMTGGRGEASHEHAGNERRAEQALIAGVGTPGQPVAAVVWGEPQLEDGERWLAAIRGALAPGGRLWVVTSGWLRRGLPEWKWEGNGPAIRPTGPGWVLARLRKNHFDVEVVYGFHGPRSLAWGFAGRLPAVAGRQDLVDRCLAAMRESYVVKGWQARWAPVGIVRARRR